MTFSNKKGSALPFALVLGLILAVVGTGVVSMLNNNRKASKRSSQEGYLLITAHSIANLFKQELFRNHNDFQNSGPWGPCRSGTDLDGAKLLKVLQKPDDPALVSDVSGCPNVNFSLSEFKVDRPTSNAFKLSEIKNLTFTPISTNNLFTVSFKVTDFNIDPARNQLIGEMKISTDKPYPMNKTLRMAIDVKRTIASPIDDPQCHICRTSPGSVCCNGDSNFSLSCLDNSGRLIDIEHDEELQRTTITESAEAKNVRAVTIKLTGGRKDFDMQSFCLNNLQSGPVLWVTDVVNNESGTGYYYLTTHGNVIKNEASPFPGILYEPTLSSIGFSGGRYFMLRSDGAVFWANAVKGFADAKEIKGLRLPICYKLTVGSAPVPPATLGSCP